MRARAAKRSSPAYFPAASFMWPSLVITSICGKIVALADFEVVGIVRGRDFHDAGAEFAVDVGVRDDRNFAIHQRQHHALADEVLVALVLRMNGDGGVAEHGFRARGGDHEKFFRADDGIADVPDFSGALVVDDFEIADRGLAARAPIDHVASAIDQPFAIETQKRFDARRDRALVRA